MKYVATILIAISLVVGIQTNGIAAKIAVPETAFPISPFTDHPFSLSELQYLLLVHETLLVQNDAGDFVPLLAERITEDGQNIRLHLRRGVKFHSGAFLDAESVVETHRRYQQMKSVHPIVKQMVVRKIDQFTIEIRTNGIPVTRTMDLLSTPFFVVSDLSATERLPKGTGPYIHDPEKYSPGASYVLPPHKEYWRERAKGPLELVSIGHTAARMSSILSQEVLLSDVDDNTTQRLIDVFGKRVVTLEKATPSYAGIWIRSGTLDSSARESLRQVLKNIQLHEILGSAGVGRQRSCWIQSQWRVPEKCPSSSQQEELSRSVQLQDIARNRLRGVKLRVLTAAEDDKIGILLVERLKKHQFDANLAYQGVNWRDHWVRSQDSLREQNSSEVVIAILNTSATSRGEQELFRVSNLNDQRAGILNSMWWAGSAYVGADTIIPLFRRTIRYAFVRDISGKGPVGEFWEPPAAWQGCPFCTDGADCKCCATTACCAKTHCDKKRNAEKKCPNC